MGNLNETESIIIGCIIGGSCLIVFGIGLWFFCSKKNPKATEYDKLSQNDGDNAKDDIENGTKAILETTPLSQPDGHQNDTSNKLLPTNSKPHVLISVQKSIDNDPEHKEPITDYEVKIENEDDSNVELVRGVLSYNNDQNPSKNDPALKSFTNTTIASNTNTNVNITANITPKAAEVIEYEEEHEETTQIAGKRDVAASNAGNKSSTDLNAVVEDKQTKEAKSEIVTAEETKDEHGSMEDEEEDEVNVINSNSIVTPAKNTGDKDSNGDVDKEVIEKKDTLNEDGYDIDNEEEDIVRPLGKQALQQNMSTESQASTRSAMSASTKAVLAMDSDANVFGNRWGDDTQGFEWNENDSTTMRANNDGAGDVDKNEDGNENDDNNEANEANEEDK